MAHKTQVLTCKKVIDAPPAEVYRAFTSATALREWFCDAAQVEARKGGRFYAWWNSGYYAAGEFLSVNPNKKVVLIWQGRGEPEATQVQVTFSPKAGGTNVSVAHSGIWSGRQWAAAVAEFEKGWQTALRNLKCVLETGEDPRFVNRPMLGINVGDFNAEAASRLGVPATEGVLVDSAIDGMGAHAAGLRPGDVMVRIGQDKVTGWNSLAAVLQKYQAGDQVPVEYYRGGEKQKTVMELSRRQVPEIHSNPERLAEELRRIYAEVDAELDRTFAGVTDAEASRQPAPGEWSPKEHLAHLISSERWTHLWLAGLLTSLEAEVTPDNATAIYSAMASTYSVADMVSEMKHNEAETVAMVAALPAAFVERKGSYWRMGYNLLQPPTHTLDHLQQVKAVVAEARGET